MPILTRPQAEASIKCLQAMKALGAHGCVDFFIGDKSITITLNDPRADMGIDIDLFEESGDPGAAEWHDTIEEMAGAYEIALPA